jgi:hypothetical protein
VVSTQSTTRYRDNFFFFFFFFPQCTCQEDFVSFGNGLASRDVPKEGGHASSNRIIQKWSIVGLK